WKREGRAPTRPDRRPDRDDSRQPAPHDPARGSVGSGDRSGPHAGLLSRNRSVEVEGPGVPLCHRLGLELPRGGPGTVAAPIGIGAWFLAAAALDTLLDVL